MNIYFKGGGKASIYPNNYRAISLIPIHAKVFEKLLLKIIMDNGYGRSISHYSLDFNQDSAVQCATELFARQSVMPRNTTARLSAVSWMLGRLSMSFGMMGYFINYMSLV